MLVLGPDPARGAGCSSSAPPRSCCRSASTCCTPTSRSGCTPSSAARRARTAPGWAILQMHIALAWGGLTGGAGHPLHRLVALYLPERETDLAFASLVEQHGHRRRFAGRARRGRAGLAGRRRQPPRAEPSRGVGRGRLRGAAERRGRDLGHRQPRPDPDRGGALPAAQLRRYGGRRPHRDGRAWCWPCAPTGRPTGSGASRPGPAAPPAGPHHRRRRERRLDLHGRLRLAAAEHRRDAAARDGPAPDDAVHAGARGPRRDHRPARRSCSRSTSAATWCPRCPALVRPRDVPRLAALTARPVAGLRRQLQRHRSSLDLDRRLPPHGGRPAGPRGPAARCRRRPRHPPSLPQRRPARPRCSGGPGWPRPRT